MNIHCDLDIRDFYYQYIHNIKHDKHEYHVKVNELKQNIDDIYNIINNNKDVILRDFNLNLDNYTTEFVNKQYNEHETLNNNVNSILDTIDIHNNKYLLIQIVKYCQLLKEKNKYNNLILTLTNRDKISLREFEAIVKDYYYTVHAFMLEGDAYKFAGGIGCMAIVRRKNTSSRTKIDFKATKLKKQELIDKGLKPYDDNEAAWYKARHIPYDGIDYRVYLNATHINVPLLFNSIYFKYEYAYKFHQADFIHTTLRGKTIEDWIEMCKTKDDIYSFPVGLKYKISMLIKKYPSTIFNFIRNDEE